MNTAVEQSADQLLAILMETRELIYQIAEELGISRADLNARAGVNP